MPFSIMDAARLLQAAPTAANLIAMTQRAAKGDREAIEYLKTQGWHEGLDLIQPGAGQMARATLEGARVAYETYLNGGVIEGEYREVNDNPPYAHFTKWIASLRSGTVVFIGPKGEGKTAGLQRLAEVWHERNGYTVYQVNFDPKDQRRLPWATNITISKFVAEMRALAKAWEDSSDDDDDKADEAKRHLRGFRRRIYLIDEAALAIAPTGPAAGKQAARTAMGLSRHIPFLCGYIGQWAKNMPSDMFGSEAIFVRHPHGKEVELDRDDAVVRDLWASAIEAFAHIRSYQWFTLSPIVRSWSYVDAPGVYQGLVPFVMPGYADIDYDLDEEDDDG